MDMDGMVAMVRAMPDASLAMSLMDGCRQYSLVPQTNTHAGTPASTYCASAGVQAGSSAPLHSVATEPYVDNTKVQNGVHNHCAAQAVDGRYASVYQMSHCSVNPTSPPVLLTEFPPQRPEPCKGQGNFVVGGVGSGECYTTPTKISQAYRGGMNWPDRSVYPRLSPHYEPDPFAHSLRKYPSLSPERSAEVIQRLINYTTMKNSSSIKNTKSSLSPTRSESSSPTAERTRTCVTALRARVVDDAGVRCGVEGRKVVDESPTRDGPRLSRLDELAEMKKATFGRNYDVRFVRELTRRAKENIRYVTYPYNHPVCPPIKERYDHMPPKNAPLYPEITKSHMETQAEIPMVSKEVTTLPREKPSMRNIAIPLSPSASDLETNNPTECQQTDTKKPPSTTKIHTTLSHKSIQTTSMIDLTLMKPRKSAQTCISSIDLHETNNKIVKNCRKTKSQEEIRSNDEIDDELLQIIKELNNNYNNDTSFCVRNGLLKKLKKISKTERGDKIKTKLERSVRDQLYAHADYKQFTRELSNELISKIKASNMVLKCYDSDKVIEEGPLVPYKLSSSEKSINGLIREWLDEIPIKSVDYLGRPVKKEHVLNAMASKVKSLIMNKAHQDRYITMKPDILDILDDVPIDVNARNKMAYLNRISHDLIKKIGDVFTANSAERMRWQKAIDMDNVLRNNLRRDSFVKYDLPTDIELKRFVSQQLRDFTTKFRIKICHSTEKEIEIELVDILIDSFNDFRHGEEEKIKEEILITLSEFIQLSEHEGIYFVNNLMYNFKDFLKELQSESVIPQTFVILRSTVKNSSNQTLDFHIQGNTEDVLDNNLEIYTEKIVQQINEWMENIQDLKGVDKSYKRVVAHDLAEDIVDRHKYLELNPNNRSTDEDELEHLKYQIFKWVGKLVGEENYEIIEHASQLMRMIENIPGPIHSRPAQNIDTGMPVSCKKDDRELRTHKEVSSDRKRLQNVFAQNTFETMEMQASERKQSSPKSTFLSEQIQTNVYTVNASTNSQGIMTCPSQAGNSPPIEMPKRTACAGTEMTGSPQMRPRSTSMAKMECPSVRQNQDRRGSSPAGFTYGYGNMPAPQGPTQQATMPPRSPNVPPPLCCDPEINPENLKQRLNEEYEHYLDNWVSQIPIITSKPEEQALLGLMRKGIYNGVWKALAKLRMNPAALTNRFHYQDVFDDELEELLGLLPDSEELTKKKQMMKNQLIEKTIKMNEQLLHIGSAATYKQQLVDNVFAHVPRKTLGFTESDLDKICEDIHKLNLAETFIILTLYNRHNDVVKANVYKKKLLKQIQNYFDEFKKIQGTNTNPMDKDFAKYKDDILNDLYKVPSPTDETIREEADEVLIGLEIEQWFQDLPLYDTVSNFESLCRKRYRDNLAQKIHEMEKKYKNLNDCEDELRHEITRFMSKLPIREKEIENTHFMIEELVNRLKNRPKDLVAGNRLANFVDPYDYDEFSRNMPLCSSFSQGPDARKAQINESSYMVRDGDRLEDSCSRFQYIDDLEKSSPKPVHWYSLQEEGDHRQLPQVVQGPSCCQPNGNLGSNVVDGSLPRASLPRDASYRIPDIRRTSGGECPRYATLQQTQLGAPCCPDPTSPAARFPNPPPPRSPGPPSPRHQDQFISRSPQMVPGSPRPQEPNPPCCENKSLSSSIEMPKYREMHMPRIPEMSSVCSSQRDEEPQQNQQCCGMAANLPGNAHLSVPTAYPQPECCLEPSENVRSPQPIPGRSADSEPYPFPPAQSLDPTPMSCPGSSTARKVTADFGNPNYQSTPQDVPLPRESRPKKREREDKQRREKKREVTDSDDSVREEVRCRCMERIWRRKKKMYPPCDECDMGIPPCFPMRYAPFPYYF